MKHEKKPRKLKLVLDTNVFISGLISKRGSPGLLLQAFEKKKFTLLLSDNVMAEYLRVLDYPKIRKYPGITDEFISHVLALCIQFGDRIEVESQIIMSRDPDDDKFLELAVDGKANMLVSGDKADLLSLKQIQGIPIVTAAQCVYTAEFG